MFSTRANLVFGFLLKVFECKDFEKIKLKALYLHIVFFSVVGTKNSWRTQNDGFFQVLDINIHNAIG